MAAVALDGGWLWIAAAIVVVLVLALRAARAASHTTISVSTSEVTSQSIKGLSRAEIDNKLRELAKSPKPKIHAAGAMCYYMAAPPERAEYICPTCGEKTLYIKKAAYEVESEIQYARRQIQLLQQAAGDGLALDESQFCRHCSPDTKVPKLVLIIQYDDGKTIKLAGISSRDLLLLTDFFSGERVHRMVMEKGKPLKGYRKRLRKLLLGHE